MKKSALILVSLLIGACGGGKTDDSPTTTDSGTTTTTDTTTTSVDTGLAQLMYVGDIATNAGAFSSGHFGFGFRGVSSGTDICTITGELALQGAAPEGCPGCEWSFDLGPVANSTATGDHCGDVSAVDGSLDGYFDYSWGFAATYPYSYAGIDLVLEDTVLFFDGVQWFPFAFNYGTIQQVTGDANALQLEVNALDNAGQYIYYYYFQ